MEKKNEKGKEEKHNNIRSTIR